MAVVGDKVQQMSKEKARLDAVRTFIEAKLAGNPIEAGEGVPVDLAEQDNATLTANLEEVATQQELISAKMIEEDHRRTQWREENKRRRHNYVPLIFELLKKLANKGKLGSLLTEAKERKAVKKQGDTEMKEA